MHRFVCPVCMSSHKRDDWELTFIVPDGWTLPGREKVCCCLDCGFVYYSNSGTQADYDKYYSEKYGYGLDSPDNYRRLDELASLIGITFFDSQRIRDFGGGDGYLVRKLKELGFQDVATWNVGDPEPSQCSLIVASHVLEHVYYLDNVMSDLKRSLVPSGYILVEVPDAMAYSFRKEPHLLDYNTKHCNHFSPFHMDLLFNRYGFSAVDRWHPEIKIQNAKCYRALYQLDDRIGMWHRSGFTVICNMANKAKKLKEINNRFIIWGCSDTTWYLVNEIPAWKIAYFVDKDTKAYSEGTTIKGIPVFNSVHSDEPIVVMAQGQQQQIIDNIRSLGLRNEVIVV
jgi:hypothetical protein